MYLSWLCLQLQSSHSPTSSSNSSSWLSSFLYFHPCESSSVLGPIPIPTHSFNPPTNTPPVRLPPHPLHLPSILGPPPFPNTALDFLPNLSPHTPLPEPITHTPTAPTLLPNPSPQPPLPEPTTHTTFAPGLLPNPSPQLHLLEPTPHPTIPSSPIATNAVPAICQIPNPHISSHPMTTRFKFGISKEKIFSTTTSLDYLQTEPPNYTIASKIPEWRATMTSEFEALQRQHTWSLVPPSPSQNLVGCRWVYKIKRATDGSVSRYKARLVAKGFHQQAGMDYAETFSPVVKPPTVRIILSLAAQNRWNLRQLDVSNAFLHGFLKETVYMAQPTGFVDEGQPSHVCHLHKSLYGLKQAPRAWFERFTSHLLTLGFTASVADASLFVLKQGSVIVYLLLYVDDIIITGSDSTVVSTIISQLSTTFEVKDLGPLRYFLGLQIDYKNAGFFVHQSKYITDLLTKFKMSDCKAVSTPIATSPVLSTSCSDSLADPTPYRSLVGALQYATFTRPDITFAVNRVCQFMHNPSFAHLVAAKRILRYLKGSLDKGILFQPGPLTLTAFTDADWAGDPVDRRSTSGITVFLGNNPITWMSKKQHTVSRSSTEAEYRSLATGAVELAWLRQVICDLGLYLASAPIMWCDNTSALALASNPVFHGRTKHIEVDYHFVRERVVRGDICLQFVSTDDQVADIFTKALPTPRFQLLCSKLLIDQNGCRSAPFAPPFLSSVKIGAGLWTIGRELERERTTGLACGERLSVK
uniref:Reverse transcriptase Ty1/copia-type domain-containing protein n=1 Tax=Fagus sylvatica TaxID=28930 RepID=A0A2N9GPU6_FAGSY